MPQRIVSVRRPAPLHLQKLVEARKPRVPPSELPRAGATGIGFFPSPTAVSVEHGSRFAHIPYSPIHKAQNSPRLSYQRLEERGSSQTDKLAVSFDAPAWTQIDNVKILSPSHPTRHRRAPASCRPGGVSVILPFLCTTRVKTCLLRTHCTRNLRSVLGGRLNQCSPRST